MSLAAIRRALLEINAKRLSNEHPIWETSSPWWPFSRRARRYETVRVEILQATIALPGPTFLVIDENPQEYDVGGFWAHAQARTWVIPDGCDPDALEERVLALGSWALYCRPEAIGPASMPDCFREPPVAIASFAIAHGVPLFIQAFHDNDPWRVWVEDVRSQHSQREVAA